MLAKFLEKLGADTELLEAYKKDPRSVMKEHGVSHDDIEAILSGDEDRIQSISTSTKGFKMLIVSTGDER